MTITYPRDMPVGGIDEQYFEIERNDALSPSGRGRVYGVQQGFPLWYTEIGLSDDDADAADEWTTFVDTLDGAGNLFYGYDVTRPYPKAYPSGLSGMTRPDGAAFDGSAAAWSLNAARNVVSVTGMPAGFSLSLRDYVGFKWSTYSRALVRVTEAGIADGAGNLTFSVRPAVPGSDTVTIVPATATLHFDKPKCLMRLMVSKTKLSSRDVLQAMGGTIAAIQDLIA